MNYKKPYSGKINLFLGAYVNLSNAQNLNCRSLATSLNKEMFRIKALTSYSGDLTSPDIDGVEYISTFYPHRISKYIAYLKGIYWCDIAYLCPKGEISRFNKFF